MELQNGVTDYQIHHSRATTPVESDLPLTLVDNVEPLRAEGQPNNKRRRKKSIVWDYFTVQTVEDGCVRACCNQCNKSFAYVTGSKLAGTSHLKRHIALGICPVSRQQNQSNEGRTPASTTISSGNATNPPRKRYRATPAFASIPFDQNRCNHDIAIMIIMHEYPLYMVDQPGFVDFVKTLQPQFNMMSITMIREECESIYLREKESLLNFMCGIPSRISLSLDIWTSNHSFGYVFLRGHFVDSNWSSHCRILNVVRISSPYGDDALNQAIITCLSDWRLDGRIFTLTVEQSLLNDTIAGNLRAFLVANDPNFLNGQLLLGNCLAQVLCQLTQDALSSTSEVVWKIRESVKYVKTSFVREEKFLELMHQLQVPNKDFSIDNQTKWDTTYHMLASACKLKEVFSCLGASDPDYKITLSMDDWKLADTLCTYLKYFFDVANILTSPFCPTANVFFPEVSKIQMELTNASMSQDPCVRDLTEPLKETFDRYWRDCCLILAIAVVLDPRFKLRFVEFSFSKMFVQNAEDWTRIVDYGLHDLFLQYTMETLTLSEAFGEDGNLDISLTDTHQEEHEREIFLTTGDGLSDFDVYISEISDNKPAKSELDRYLEEQLSPRSQEFNVLSWWRLNKFRYPTLSKMACDILSMPVSTVAPESVFDTEIRRIDSHRSSLSPATLEALICARDWLQCGSLLSPPPPTAEMSDEAIVKREY